MKFGCERGIQPCLEFAGDGMQVVNLRPLINLCRMNPKVRLKIEIELTNMDITLI